MPRNVVLSLVATYGLAVAAVIAAVGWTHHKPYPCRATFERVREGMTLAEVEATVGGPPGEHSTGAGHREEVESFIHMRGGTEPGVGWRWGANEAELLVLFSWDGVAQTVTVNYYPRPSRPERLLAWLVTGRDHWARTLPMSFRPPAYSLHTVGQILDD